MFLKIPYLKKKIKASVRQKVLDAFGGRFKLLAVGGAALNHEVEAFLADIRFPYTVGYGMTECGPGISFDNWMTFRLGSCGKAVDRMEIRIDSSDAHRIVGEILVKGTNVMKGIIKIRKPLLLPSMKKAGCIPGTWVFWIKTTICILKGGIKI